MTIITPCRPATPGEIPKTAKTLATLAEAHGWTVVTTYARGSWGTGRHERVIDSLAVRMRREGKLAAIWHDGKFHGGISQSRTYTLTELRELVQR